MEGNSYPFPNHRASLPSPSGRADKKFWAVASGKGGVGKTFVATSMAITLAKTGHSVILLDLDPAGANVHTCLGLEPAAVSIRNWFDSEKNLQEIVTPTKVPHLGYIQGFWDSWSPVSLNKADAERLAQEIPHLKADIIIVDLGAGFSDGQMTIFAAANEKILVTSPEPTSIERNYRFIEAFLCHKLSLEGEPGAYKRLVEVLRKYRAARSGKHFSFRRYLRDKDGLRLDPVAALTEQPIRLIVNGSRSHSNAELGHSIRSVCDKYYDLKIDYAGSIDFDNAVWQSVRSREPVLLAQPFTPLAGQFLGICKHIVDQEELRAVV